MSANIHEGQIDVSATEPQFDFDRLYDRRGTHSIKWEFLLRNGDVSEWDNTDPALGDDAVLPMWVADMDFHVAQPIQDAVEDSYFGSRY
jgi:cysteine-S-conjugate beta-lyase